MDASTQSLIDVFGDDDSSIEEAAVADHSLLDDYFAPDELTPELVEVIRKVAARGLYELFRYCFGGRPVNEKGLQIAARRFVAVAWLLHSEMLTSAELGENGNPRVLTLEQLSKLPQLDCTRCAMSVHAKNFGDQWKFHARVQKRLGAKPNYAAAARKGWKKRENRSENAAPRKNPTQRRCRRCHEIRPVADFKLRHHTCDTCFAASELKIYPKPDRECSSCHAIKPAAEFEPKFRTCRHCVASRKPQEPPSVLPA